MTKPTTRGRPVDSRRPIRAALRLQHDLEDSYDRITRLVPKVQLLQAILDGFLKLPVTQQVEILLSGTEETGDEKITHEITRILDPELTPSPGSKSSDRTRAKRAD